MVTTPDLGLPLLETQQQQPNVTHNEMVMQISALANGVISVGVLNAPPGSPVFGDAYVIAGAPTGAWAGKARCVTVYTSGGWRFIPDRDDDGTPLTMGARQHGLRVFNRADDCLYVWDGAAWQSIACLLT